jgi:hypothetical protein
LSFALTDSVGNVLSVKVVNEWGTATTRASCVVNGTSGVGLNNAEH